VRTTIPFAFQLTACVLLALQAVAAPTPHKHPAAHKHPSIGTKGTSQMAGANLQFGQTYTYAYNGSLYNFTIVSAEYSSSVFNLSPTENQVANDAQKLLIIHFRFKNPNSQDLYFADMPLFEAVDANGNTIKDIGASRRAGAKQVIGMEVKPGQGIDDLVTCIVIPTAGPVSKLILQMGRAGTSDTVTRFQIGTPPNVIAPLAAPYADPSDKTGTTLASEIPSTVGTTYHAGGLDISLDNVKLEPGPIGDHTADDGKQFLVATVTVTNKFMGQWYFSDGIKPILKTDEDKITDCILLKGSHDTDFDGRTMDSGDTATQRIVLQVPKDATLKTLTLVNQMGNSGNYPGLVYDVSNLK